MEALASIQALDGILACLAAWLAIGLAGIVALRNFRVVARILFPLSALLSVAVAALALGALPAAAQSTVLGIGLPDLPFHLRLDALSAFFLVLLGLSTAGISLFSAGYFADGGLDGAIPGVICLEYHLFLASMAMVLMADDAYVFMVAWETMALA